MNFEANALWEKDEFIQGQEAQRGRLPLLTHLQGMENQERSTRTALRAQRNKRGGKKNLAKELGWICGLESDRNVTYFTVIFMEIVNIKCHIEAKVLTSWTQREEMSKQNCKTFFFF